MKVFLAHASAFDYKTKLYAPIRASVLNTQHQITLPEERESIWNTKEEIEKTDLFIADVSIHSTGCGIELGWAHAAGRRIVCIHEKGSKPSEVIVYVSDVLIEYESPEDLIKKLDHLLSS